MLKQLIYTVSFSIVRVTLHTSNDHTSEISMQLVDKDDEVLFESQHIILRPEDSAILRGAKLELEITLHNGA